MSKTNLIPLLAALTGLVGCGDAEEAGSLKPRRGVVLVEGCTLDAWQQATLSAPETKRVVSEVVLRCLALRQEGSIAPADATARSALRTLTAELKSRGFLVSLALTAQSDDGVDHPPERLLDMLSNATTRGRATNELTSLAPAASFLELALPPLPDGGRAVLTQWAMELSAALRPATRLAFQAPPSTQEPSELPGGGAVDLRGLAPSFDRIRVMTTDFSCCDGVAGPTTESGWLVGAASFARTRIGSATPAIDVTLPLYGVDFSQRGQRAVSYLEAVGIAQHHGRQIQRAPGYTLHFDWSEADGTTHELWFDDAAATARHQQQFDPALDDNVGILYYGLGSEDPSLFGELARQR